LEKLTDRRPEQPPIRVTSGERGRAHHREVDVGVGNDVEEIGENSLRRNGQNFHDRTIAEAGFTHRPNIGVTDLSSLRCVTFDFLSQPAGWMFGRGKAVITVPVCSRFSVNTAGAAIDAAIAGAGVTRALSYQAAKAIRDGTLQTILEPFEPEPLPVSLLHPAQSMMPRKTRSFIDFAAPALRTNLSAAGH
jgi:DNA-binding transcriptional LysR family regulator